MKSQNNISQFSEALQGLQEQKMIGPGSNKNVKGVFVTNSLKKIAKGIADPGFDYFNQLHWFGLVELV